MRISHGAVVQVVPVLIRRFLSLSAKGTGLPAEGTNSLALALVLSRPLSFSESFSEPETLPQANSPSCLESLGKALHRAILAVCGPATNCMHTGHVFATDVLTDIRSGFGWADFSAAERNFEILFHFGDYCRCLFRCEPSLSDLGVQERLPLFYESVNEFTFTDAILCSDFQEGLALMPGSDHVFNFHVDDRRDLGYHRCYRRCVLSWAKRL